jgi:excisionase family DNA binding protein
MQQLLTTHQVSNYLQIKPRVILEMVKKAKIPAIKIGKEWRFDEEDLQKLIEKRKTKVLK